MNQPTIDAGQRAGDLFSGFLGAGGGTDWGGYVRGNSDALANWNAINGTSAGEQFNGDINAFGQYHYDQDGARRDLGAYTSDGAQASGNALDAFRGSTGYQDLVKEGLSAVNANAYARGAGDSGATLKALQDRGTSLADRSAQGWLGNLGTLMNLGGQARGLVAGVGTNTVNANNAASQGAADSSSNAALVNGQNWSNTLQNIGNSAAYAYGSSYGSPQGAAGGFKSPTPYTTPPYAGYGLNPGYA